MNILAITQLICSLAILIICAPIIYLKICNLILDIKIRKKNSVPKTVNIPDPPNGGVHDYVLDYITAPKHKYGGYLNDSDNNRVKAMKEIRSFLLRNGFEFKESSLTYRKKDCLIVVYTDTIAIFYKDNHHECGHNLYEIIGVLTYNYYIPRNYK